MPLSAPAPRRAMHRRLIDCQCFLREDGLWEIEAHLVDTKPYTLVDWRRGALTPGMPVHDMTIRMTVTEAMEIRAIEAVADHAPFQPCFDVPAVFQRLVGEKIGPGWRDRVRRRIGRTEGCTHMLELLDPLATSAYQAMSAGRDPDGKGSMEAYRAAGEATGKRPFFIDGCHAWRADGPVVAEIFPEFTGPARKS